MHLAFFPSMYGAELATLRQASYSHLGAERRLDIDCGAMVPCSGARSLVDGVDSSATTGYQYLPCTMAAPSFPFAGVENEEAVSAQPGRYIYRGLPLSFFLFFPMLFELSGLADFAFSLLSIAHRTSTILSSLQAVDDMEPTPRVTCFLLHLGSRGNA
jgi:hypothetical protein